MKHLAIGMLILVMATSSFATDRTTAPTNPNAYNQQGTNEGSNDSHSGVVVDSRDATIYFDAAEFVAMLDPNHYFDDFAEMDWGTISETDTYQFGPINGYSYTVFVAGGIFSIPGAISTNSAFDPMVITFDGDPVFAVGGDFFGSDFDGLPIPAMVYVTLADGTEVLLEQPAVFVGFSSNEPITQLTISTTTTSPNVYLAFDNFYVGQLGTVAAEPASWGNVKALYK